MFIEKYQPYTSLLVTYNSVPVTPINPITLPTVIKGEYKINLDAVGYDSVDDRGNLPFTRDDITWWLIDVKRNLLTKEINVGDDAGTKFTIDDSGTLSIISTAFSASEHEELHVLCVLGKPNSLNLDEFDFDTIVTGGIDLPFSCGGGGGDVPFPRFSLSIDTNEWTCNLTYAQTYDVCENYGIGQRVKTIPCVINNRAWDIAIYLPSNDETIQTFFPHIPESVNNGFMAGNNSNPTLFYADNGIIYKPNTH